jgi:lactobin A/cerein 7B family class IIb bacteriocin
MKDMKNFECQNLTNEELMENNGGEWVIAAAGLALACYTVALPIAYYCGYLDGKEAGQGE